MSIANLAWISAISTRHMTTWLRQCQQWTPWWSRSEPLFSGSRCCFVKISLFSENVCWINLNFLNKLDTDQPKRTNDSIAWNFQSWPIKFTSLQSFVALQIIFGLDVKENFEYLATNCKTAVIWSWRRPSRIGLIKGQQEPCLSVKMPDWAQNVPDSLATVLKTMDRHQIHCHNCE